MGRKQGGDIAPAFARGCWSWLLVTAQLAGSGGGSATTVYLPEHLGPQLPAVPRLKVRLVVEAHPHQHPADGEGVALRTLALGRVIGSRGRGAY